jgi:hypothetical protein
LRAAYQLAVDSGIDPDVPEEFGAFGITVRLSEHRQRCWTASSGEALTACDKGEAMRRAFAVG